MKVCQLNFLTFLDSLLNIKNNKDKVQLFAPIWLEEIQSNKIYKKYSERNQKIEEDKSQEIDPMEIFFTSKNALNLEHSRKV